MANLTLAVDDELLRRARVRAAEDGTSVNAAVRQFLDDFAGNRTAHWTARDHLVALAQQSSASSDGLTWTRDELHD